MQPHFGSLMRKHGRHLLTCKVLFRTHYKQESGKELLAGIYFTPVEPQKTRIMGKFVSKAAKPAGGAPKKKPGISVFSLYFKLLNALGATHILGGGLGDQVRSKVPMLMSSSLSGSSHK